jgi:hypothetical protein
MWWNRMSEAPMLSEADARALIGRCLVIESAKAAGLLVATPQGGAGEGRLLVASPESRADGSLIARRVRVRVLEGNEPTQRLASPAPEAGEWFAVVNWDRAALDAEDSIYLFPPSILEHMRPWRQPECLASARRWAAMVQGESDTESGG